MKKLVLASAILAAFTGSIAQAEEEKKPDHEVSYNIGVVNEYRYRGISQSRFDPALQGGIDYTNNPTGLYAGTWLSTIKWIKDYVNTAGGNGKGGVEWDLYAGKRGELPGGFTYDVGGLYYWYPNNNYDTIAPNKDANTFELYGQIGYGPAYIKYSHSLTELFGTVDSKGSGYLDLGANIDVGSGVTLNLHAGHQKVKGTGGPGAGLSNSFYSYTDWKVGVSKTFEELGGFTLGLAGVGTNANDGAYASAGKTNFGKKAVVVSAVKTF